MSSGETKKPRPRLPNVTQLYRSAAFYPITFLYLGGVSCALMVSQDYIPLESGIVLFAFMAMLALLVAAYTELRTVHKLVDGQRTELLARIDELTSILTHAGITAPAPGHREQDARDDVRRHDHRHNPTSTSTPEQEGDDVATI